MLIAIIMIPSLVKFGIMIDFKINQDFIAKVLCINKDVPTSTCNGNCYLTRQLKKVEEPHEQQTSNTTKEKVEIIYCLSDNIIELDGFTGVYIEQAYPIFVNKFWSSIHAIAVFHPPQSNFI